MRKQKINELNYLNKVLKSSNEKVMDLMECVKVPRKKNKRVLEIYGDKERRAVELFERNTDKFSIQLQYPGSTLKHLLL